MAPSFTQAAENDLANVKAEVTKRQDEAVKRLRDWIKLPSIVAEDINPRRPLFCRRRQFPELLEFARFENPSVQHD